MLPSRRTLIDSIPTDTVRDLRDRALLATNAGAGEARLRSYARASGRAFTRLPGLTGAGDTRLFPGSAFARVTILAEMIKHHVKEKEKAGEGFFARRKGDVDMEALGRTLQARKEQLLAAIKEDGLPPPKPVA